MQSSLVTAKATIISALERNESRGAHQRSDFQRLNPTLKFNCVVSMNKNGNLKVSRVPLKDLRGNLKKIVENKTKDDDIRGKLLE